MKITSKGQVTIPQKLRERFGFLPETEVEFVPDGDGLRLVHKASAKGRGRALIQHMRRHPGTIGMTTDQILRLTRGENDDTRG